MTAAMLHYPSAVGLLTSGGTESLLMAMKTYRDWACARHPHQTVFEVVCEYHVLHAHILCVLHGEGGAGEGGGRENR